MIDSTDYYLAQHLLREDELDQLDAEKEQAEKDALKFLKQSTDWTESNSMRYAEPDFYLQNAIYEDLDATVKASYNKLMSSEAAEAFRCELADYIAKQELGDD